jgi:hypothetical protein
MTAAFVAAMALNWMVIWASPVGSFFTHYIPIVS